MQKGLKEGYKHSRQQTRVEVILTIVFLLAFIGLKYNFI